jgi:hypothetical protein
MEQADEWKWISSSNFCKENYSVIGGEGRKKIEAWAIECQWGLARKFGFCERRWEHVFQKIQFSAARRAMHLLVALLFLQQFWFCFSIPYSTCNLILMERGLIQTDLHSTNSIPLLYWLKLIKASLTTDGLKYCVFTSPAAGRVVETSGWWWYILQGINGLKETAPADKLGTIH